MRKIIILAVSVVVLIVNARAEDATVPAAVGTSPKPIERTTEEIILLPKMVVEGSKVHAFSERELLTQAGMDELLMKRFPGATFKGQPREMDNYALLMYDDEKRLNALNHYQALADLLRDTGDTGGSKELRNELNRTFIRSHDWKTERMDRTANGGRR